MTNSIAICASRFVTLSDKRNLADASDNLINAQAVVSIITDDDRDRPIIERLLE